MRALEESPWKALVPICGLTTPSQIPWAASVSFLLVLML